MSVVPETMRAARMHDVGAPMVIEDVPTPRPAPLDVLVRVRACGIVPNLGNVLKNWTNWFPQNPLPDLPAPFGLDPSGRSEEHTSELQSLMRISYAAFCLK